MLGSMKMFSVPGTSVLLDTTMRTASPTLMEVTLTTAQLAHPRAGGHGLDLTFFFLTKKKKGGPRTPMFKLVSKEEFPSSGPFCFVVDSLFEVQVLLRTVRSVCYPLFTNSCPPQWLPRDCSSLENVAERTL